MMLDPWWGLALSTTCSFVVGVERGWFLVGGGLAHCWVLKHQDRVSPQAPLFVGGGCGGVRDCVSGLSLLCLVVAVRGCWGLVGLLFEICIVDASIN